nr:MAG TPA: protein of unknown function (DUF4969) [Caudoviricetes sp.]
MKKIIILMSVLLLMFSLICGCIAKQPPEDDNTKNEFGLNVDVDEFVCRQEKKLQEFSKINDLTIKVDDKKESITITVPVAISGDNDSIRKAILDDQSTVDMINNLFNKAVSNFDFCNPIASYKIDLNITNKNNNESIFEIIDDEETTTAEIQKILKKDIKDTDKKDSITKNNNKKQSKKNDNKKETTDNSNEYYDNTRYDSEEVLSKVEQKIDSTLGGYYIYSELIMKNNIVGVHLYPSEYLKSLANEGNSVYEYYDNSYEEIGQWLSDEFGYDVKYFVIVIDNDEELYTNSNY